MKGDVRKPVTVPCCKCIGCHLERSRQWAIRCVNEMQMQEENGKQNCFITLTYRNEELTYGGEGYTLYPRHLQLFLKRLRKKYGPAIRFFACGEYGDKLGRPHYHAIIFGLDFEDKTIHSVKEDTILYRSNTLDNLWTHGGATIGAANFETAAYVARYVLKKKLGKNREFYKRVGIEPEFVRMSRRPGIGRAWLEKYKSDVYPHDRLIMRGLKMRPPKYYSNIYDLENPEQSAILKERRRKAVEKHAKDNTRSRLAAKLEVKKRQVESLSRKLT